MINVGMTIREMVSMASNTDSPDLYERIIKALEEATGNIKKLVACNGVVYSGQYWDNKIPAIKAVRLATGWGLKESKEWIEGCEYYAKTSFTPPLDPVKANELKGALENLGCHCWLVNA